MSAAAIGNTEQVGAACQSLDELSESDWQLLYQQLVAYAEQKAANLRFTKGGGPLPLGREPEDLVKEAIEAALDGRRNWNRERYPTPDLFLTSVIDSLQSNLLRSAAHRRSTGEPAEDVTGFLDEADGYVGPLDGMIYEECLEALKRICDEAADTEDLDLIRMGLEDGLKSQDMADLLGIPVDDVYPLTQKFRRRVRKAVRIHPCAEGDGTYQTYLS